MYHSAKVIVISTLAALSAAYPQNGKRDGPLQGYGTFNTYSSQNTLNCDGLFKPGKPEVAANTQNQIYQAAIGDLSYGLGPFECTYSDSDLRSDPDLCTEPQPGTSYKLPNYSYKAPACPGAPCGKCYTITNNANKKKITVQIVDACPAHTAWNYCKAIAPVELDKVPANQRCGDANTNQVDIDTSAYPALTGQSYQGGVTPNLDITIEENAGCTAP